MANTYYAAAVKSGSVSWKAWFFGAIDPGSFITVDKPPAALWVQGLSARIFGFSTFSMILPEILCGIASVLIVHHLVRRWKGDIAAHLAAVAFAVTPIAAAMFRNNNPDAFLTFLGVAAAWGVWHAVETGRTRPLIVAAALTGLAFQAKMLQAFLIVPAFVLVYVVAGPPKLGRRLLQLVGALATLVVAGGWWYVVVAAWPTASRPFIGSTNDNSIVSLLIGYNGLDRVLGSSGGGGAGAPGGGGGPSFGGTAGVFRMLNTESGGLISWLLPLAAIGLVAGLWLTRRLPRTSTERAGWLLWGGWAATCYVIFSFSNGIFHPYYEIQFAPAIAATAAVGGVTLWQLGRDHRLLRWVLPVAVGLSATWAVALLRRTSSYAPWLRPAITGLATAAIMALVVGAFMDHRAAKLAGGVLAGGALLLGPTAYTLTTVQHPVAGSLATAGPSSGGGGFGGFPGGGAGGRGGPGGATTVDTKLVQYLEKNRHGAEFLVAAESSMTSAPIIIATGQPVITIGGFSGSDPAPTLAEFKALVATGKVRYLLAGGGFGGFGGGGPGGGRGTGSEITAWARSVGTTVTVGNTTLYDLGAAVTS